MNINEVIVKNDNQERFNKIQQWFFDQSMEWGSTGKDVFKTYNTMHVWDEQSLCSGCPSNKTKLNTQEFIDQFMTENKPLQYSDLTVGEIYALTEGKSTWIFKNTRLNDVECCFRHGSKDWKKWNQHGDLLNISPDSINAGRLCYKPATTEQIKIFKEHFGEKTVEYTLEDFFAGEIDVKFETDIKNSPNLGKIQKWVESKKDDYCIDDVEYLANEDVLAVGVICDGDCLMTVGYDGKEHPVIISEEQFIKLIDAELAENPPQEVKLDTEGNPLVIGDIYEAGLGVPHKKYIFMWSGNSFNLVILELFSDGSCRKRTDLEFDTFISFTKTNSSNALKYVSEAPTPLTHSQKAEFLETVQGRFL